MEEDVTALDFLKMADPANQIIAQQSAPPPPTPTPSPKGRGRPRKNSTETRQQETRQEDPGLDAYKEEIRLKLLRKIRRYLRSSVFGPRLQDVDVRDTDSYATLEERYKEIREKLSGDMNRRIVNALFAGGLGVAEKVAVQYFELEVLSGTAEELAEDPQFDDELEEIALEMERNFVPNPYVRLAAKVIYAVNQSVEMKIARNKERDIELEEEE